MPEVKKLILVIACIIIFLPFLISAKSCANGRKNIRTGSSVTYAFSINAPSNLAATVVSYDQVILSWINNANNNDGFEIQRSLSTNTAYLTIVTLGNVNSYLDTGLTAFNTYYYRIRALNTIGDRSDWSDEVSVKTNPVWSRISCGQSSSMALANDATAWGWGYGGVLGLGTLIDRNTPNRIITDFYYAPFTDVSAITSGALFSAAAKSDKTLWVWGANGYGQYGTGDLSTTDWPSRMGVTTDEYDFLAGSDGYTIGYTYAIVRKTDGTIYSFGDNAYGQLGLGDIISRITPAQIGTQSDWSIFSAGWHTLALKTNNTMYSWGLNYNGELGVGDALTHNSPVPVGADSDWIQISSGGNFSLARKSNNTIYSFGSNDSGQLGRTIGRTDMPGQIGIASDWAEIAAAWWHSIACKTNGTIYSWGRNVKGQLGLGDTINRTSLTQIGTDSDWIEATGGEFHSLARKTNGTIWSWGFNNTGQLGLGDNGDRDIPCAIGFTVRIPLVNAAVISPTRIDISWDSATADEERVKIERCFGVPLYGTEGYTPLTTTSFGGTLYSDTTITAGNIYYYRIKVYNAYGSSAYSTGFLASTMAPGPWSNSFSAGNYHTIAVSTNGTLWAWGLNDFGQLGIGDTDYTNRNTPAQVGLDSDWLNVSANGEPGGFGPNQSFAIKINGTLWAWGNNDYGQLGTGNADSPITPALVNTESDWSIISAGVFNGLALKTNNTLWSWGDNSSGQLGMGDPAITPYVSTPTQIGAVSDWSVVSIKYVHSLAIKESKTLWSWGDNFYGQLGLGDSGATKGRNTPTQVGAESTWVNAVAGYSFTLACKSNGTAWSWGGNNYGQLGLGVANNIKRMTPSQIGIDTDWLILYAGYLHAVGSKNNGSVWSWGSSNFYFQLGRDSGDNYSPGQVLVNTQNGLLSCGGGAGYVGNTAGHNLAICDGNLWVWGYNYYGQLGLGDTDDRRYPTLVGD